MPCAVPTTNNSTCQNNANNHEKDSTFGEGAGRKETIGSQTGDGSVEELHPETVEHDTTNVHGALIGR